MTDVPVKPISEIEVKSEVSENDKILILDSVSEEARLASKDELKGDKWDKWDKWDTWSQWPQGIQWPKGDKWDKGAKGDTWATGAQWPKWDTGMTGAQWPQWPQGAKWDKWDKWDKGNTWASIVTASFSGNDIVFWKNDSSTVTLSNAKTELKWDKGDDGADGTDGTDGASIVSAAFSWNDIVFTKDDSNTVTLTDAKTELKWDTWATWAAATISVWTTTTWEPWTSASVTNSWTTAAAVFDFTIPKGAKWDTGTAATITVGTTTTWDAGTSASVTNSGTSSAAVLDFTIPKWDKWATWATWATGNWISSVTTSKSWKTTTVTMNYTSWDPTVFQVQDGADGQGSWDMNMSTYDPTSKMADAFDYDNMYNTPTLWTAASKNTWTSSWNVPILDSNWKLSTTILPAIAVTDTYTVSTTSDLTGLSSAEKGDIAIVTTDSETYILSADPYSTASNWKKLATPTDTVTSVNTKTWAVTLNADDISDSTTTNKFVTSADITKLGNLSWVNTWDQSASDFDIKDLADSTSLRSTWSGKQDALSTQTAYSSKWTSTKVATITTNSLGQVTGISETSIAFPVTSVNGSTWSVTWLQTTANLKTNLTDNSDSYYPSQKAVKTAVDAKQDALTTQTAYTTQWSTTKVPQISTNTLWQVTAITEKNIAFPVTSVNWSTWAVTGLQTTANLKTSLSDNSDSYYPSQKAVKSAVDSKQDALSTQTAYTSQWTATKVPQITTNTLWQVTNITEVTITQPTVNNSTITFAQWGVSKWQINLNQASGETISLDAWFTPWWTATTGYVVTKTAGWYEWAAPSWWDVMVSSQANNILTSWMKIWAWTQDNYDNLGTYDNNTVYLTI